MIQTEIEEAERQEQADIEFDRQVLKEKCLTCVNPREWYKEESKKMSQNVPKNQGDKNGK
jgi:ribosomal protein S21